MKIWSDYEEFSNKASLEKLFAEEKTPTRVARKVGCTVTSVKSAMKHYGLVTKKYSVNEEMRRRLKL